MLCPCGSQAAASAAASGTCPRPQPHWRRMLFPPVAPGVDSSADSDGGSADTSNLRPAHPEGAKAMPVGANKYISGSRQSLIFRFPNTLGVSVHVRLSRSRAHHPTLLPAAMGLPKDALATLELSHGGQAVLTSDIVTSVISQMQVSHTSAMVDAGNPPPVYVAGELKLMPTHQGGAQRSACGVRWTAPVPSSPMPPSFPLLLWPRFAHAT